LYDNNRKKRANKHLIKKKHKGTGIPQLVMKIKSRMTAKGIDAQLRRQRMND
jgi:hypothetical protein